MSFLINDWIHHPTFGNGQIAEDRGDKFFIRFPSVGDKIVLKSAIISAGIAPNPSFEFPRSKSSGKPRFRVVRPPSKPPLDFDHLVKRFLDVFEKGFQSDNFNLQERKYKEDAATLLRDTLSSPLLEKLIGQEDYVQVARLARSVLQATNLVFPQEKMRLNDALRESANQILFASALWDLLYSTADPQVRFGTFADMLLKIEASSWTVATYFQFLATGGELMFMKPAVTKKMADSLGIALNYKAQPNWLTYLKLQELAVKVDDELKKRSLHPKSGIDVQGFIWTSIKIERGEYGPSRIVD
jgi:hypothetical protein